MNDFFSDLNIKYEASKKTDWTGRKTNPEIGNQYWYQDIECHNINDLENKNYPNFGLIGYACDEGVRRNFGRIGAKDGPKEIRKRLAKLPSHYGSKRIVDYGDVVCINKDMEACQQAFSKSISHLISNKVFPIAIGGGHDIAYAHFIGIRDAFKNAGKRIGIINFDAHFDLRPVDDLPNSGTPFNQIISELKLEKEALDYFAIGIQKQSNTKALFEKASQESVDFVFNTDCRDSNDSIKAIKRKLQKVIDANDYVYITIDMDGFSSAYASGVSAPSPLGFSPLFIFEMLDFLLKTNKVVSFDIAEFNPKYDVDGQTAALASKLVEYIVTNISI